MPCRPNIDRFWKRINKTEYCWNWIGITDRDGYGKLTFAGKDWRAHRLSWFIRYGAPMTRHVLHKCDNRKCVNPSHLFLGTNNDNMRDMKEKGRASRGEKSALSKITSADAIKIKHLYATGNFSQKELGNLFGIVQQSISHIITKKRWSHLKD